MQKNRYWILSDVNIIRCRTKDTIEFCLMLTSSDAKKTSYHRILSDVNIIGALWVGYRIDPLPCHACRKRRLRQEQLARRIKGLTLGRKRALIEFCLMLISSDAEKQLPLNFLGCYYHQIHKNSYHWISSDVNIIRCKKKKHISLNFVWC